MVAPALAAPTGLDAAAGARASASCATSRTGSSPAAASSRRSRPSSTRTRGRFATSRCGSSNEWFGLLVEAVRDAQAEGALDPSEDATQLAFELDAYLLLANAQFVISGESAPIDRARLALRRRLSSAAQTA